jgi:hypothetical protein
MAAGAIEVDQKRRFKLKKFLTDLASGGAAAVFTETAVAPIERVKLLLQVIHAFMIFPNSAICWTFFRYKMLRKPLKRVSGTKASSMYWSEYPENKDSWHFGAAISSM